MIFVTVGTHEQQFNRLIKYIDELKRDNIIQDEVIIQTGFSNYEPKYCIWSKLYTYEQVVKNVKDARIVITHGGPSSFIMPLQIGKIPVIVPRRKEYGEHINNHQVEFSNEVAERQGNIIVVEKIDELKNIILEYDSIVKAMPIGLRSNNQKFNEEFEKVVNEMFS